MDGNQIAAASRTLNNHWRGGTKFGGLETAQRPRDRAEGYAIQGAIEGTSSKQLFGWKIAATSEPAKSISMSRGRWPGASWPRR
jgi:2-keto-4-pentenoate hydratase